MTSFLRGVLAGGTIAYLHRTAEEQSGASSEKTWGTTALEVNHLFYLAGVALNHVNIQNSHFDFYAKAAYLLTPAVLLSGFFRQKVSSNEAKAAQGLTSLYYLASLISSLVLLALGKRAFAMGSLAMLALDLAARSQKLPAWGITVFETASKAASVVAFIGYGAWILDSKTLTIWEKRAFLAAAGSIFIPKIWNFFSDDSAPNASSNARNAESSTPSSHRRDSVSNKRFSNSRVYRYYDEQGNVFYLHRCGYSISPNSTTNAWGSSSWNLISMAKRFSERPPVVGKQE